MFIMLFRAERSRLLSTCRLRAFINLAKRSLIFVTELPLSKSFSTVVSLNLDYPVRIIIQRPGSSSGRGPRCANWMQDYLEDVSKFGRKSNLKVLVLKGGIKGWVKDFEGSMMDDFEEKYWEQFK